LQVLYSFKRIKLKRFKEKSVCTEAPLVSSNYFFQLCPCGTIPLSH
jgi:hypothetical protein